MLDRTQGKSPLFPVVPRRIWHANGTIPLPRDPWAEFGSPPGCLSLSRRQPATVEGQTTVEARVCLAVPPPA